MSKEYRTISIEGCPVMGRGAHGEVYRLEADMMVKVYSPGIPVERIQRELTLTKKAFGMGLPVPIPFDVVRVGERYGAVFELLNAVSACDYIKDSEERTEEFIEKSVSLLKELHAKRIAPGELPSMKQDTLSWLLEMKELMDADTFCRVQERISSINDSLQLLHGDPNPGNFMFSDGELMLIDWDTFCCGDSIFELATLFASYKQLPGINVLAAKMFGLTIQKAAWMWQRMLELYMGKCSDQELIETEELAKLLACIRIIHYMRSHPELPDQKQAIEICREEIIRWR